jgi:hypothetical protein
MKTNSLTLVKLTLLPAAMLTLASCSSDTAPPPGETTSVTSFEKGVPGGTVVETHKVIANVTAIDTADRTVTLLTSDGKKTSVKCGPEIINFDQIHIGDQLKVTVTEELAVAMAGDGASPGASGAAVVALAPKGAKPGGVVAGTVQVTATVTAIDLKEHKATLQFPDGSTRTVAVRQDVDLTLRKVGEKVTIRCTEAMAVSVEKP